MSEYLIIQANHSLSYNSTEKYKTANEIMKVLDNLVIPNKEVLYDMKIKNGWDNENLKLPSEIIDDWYYCDYEFDVHNRKTDYSGISLYGVYNLELCFFKNVVQIVFPFYLKFWQWFLSDNQKIIEPLTEILKSIVEHINGNSLLYLGSFSSVRNRIHKHDITFSKIISYAQKNGKQGRKRYLKEEDNWDFDFYIEPTKWY